MHCCVIQGENHWWIQGVAKGECGPFFIAMLEITLQFLVSPPPHFGSLRLPLFETLDPPLGWIKLLGSSVVANDLKECFQLQGCE